jgi:hypothetical protein
MLRLPIPVVHHEGALNAARHAAFLFAKRRVAEGGRWKSSSCQGKAECRHSIPRRLAPAAEARDAERVETDLCSP